MTFTNLHQTRINTFPGTSRQPRRLIFSMQPYFNQTKRQYGRQPQFFLLMEDLIWSNRKESKYSCELKTTLNFFQIEEDLYIFDKDRLP